jgi:hypothetical protein
VGVGRDNLARTVADDAQDAGVIGRYSVALPPAVGTVVLDNGHSVKPPCARFPIGQCRKVTF